MIFYAAESFSLVSGGPGAVAEGECDAARKSRKTRGGASGPEAFFLSIAPYSGRMVTIMSVPVGSMERIRKLMACSMVTLSRPE